MLGIHFFGSLLQISLVLSAFKVISQIIIMSFSTPLHISCTCLLYTSDAADE